jgi:DNA recombination protein RmuC
MLIGAFVVGAILGGLAAWLVMRERVSAHRRAADEVSATFRSLSAQALQQNSDSFLRLAHSQLTPIAETLKTFDEKTSALDQQRQQAYGSLIQQVRSLAEGQERLRAETGNLRTALRAPHVRGRWGELQLRRVVELAGMLPHCGFPTSSSTSRAESTSSSTRRHRSPLTSTPSRQKTRRAARATSSCTRVRCATTSASSPPSDTGSSSSLRPSS